MAGYVEREFEAYLAELRRVSPNFVPEEKMRGLLLSAFTSGVGTGVKMTADALREEREGGDKGVTPQVEKAGSDN